MGRGPPQVPAIAVSSVLWAIWRHNSTGCCWAHLSVIRMRHPGVSGRRRAVSSSREPLSGDCFPKGFRWSEFVILVANLVVRKIDMLVPGQMADILSITLLDAFSRWSIFILWFKFYCNLFIHVLVKFAIKSSLPCSKLGSEQALSHYMNPFWHIFLHAHAWVKIRT